MIEEKPNNPCLMLIHRYKKIYNADDGNTEVFYFKNAAATFYSFTHEKEAVNF